MRLHICKNCLEGIIGTNKSVFRFYSQKKYSATLNLPKTTFEVWGAGKRETDIQKTCGFAELYSWQRQQARDKEFCLHDGPPYANGDPHIGHAVNKILKDILNRYKLLRGFKVHYVPGWDCHGLPIELKALSEKKEDFKQLSPMEIRKKAFKYAQKSIKRQQDAFRRWGVMADWDNHCYFTFNKEYEASQLELFYQMYEKGYVYRDLKPVNWSPSSRTALAEAELEYNSKHISPSLYVKFPVKRLPNEIQSIIGSDVSLFCLVWTTTPWTLPANEAICYMPNKEYCLVVNSNNHEWYLLAAERLEEISQIFGVSLEVKYTLSGSDLEGTLCCHPFLNEKTSPLLPANHVKMGVGTGLVHTAPAHGAEDYVVGVEHNLSLKCMVDEDGLYTEDVGEILKFKNVLTEANDIVIKLLENAGNIGHLGQYEHAYPYDWRTKKPIIIRASTQWFINTAALKKNAMDCIDSVSVLPKHASNSMKTALSGRTYWCISRQRVWGVPLPVFYDTDYTVGQDSPSSPNTISSTGHIFNDPIDNTCICFLPHSSCKSVSVDMAHITNLVRKHGTDCWWTLPIEQLLPTSLLSECGVNPSRQFYRGEDILDIWFDSGSSWSHVLKDTGGIADVYWEGEDQYGAWFQTSLLTSVAINNRAPYSTMNQSAPSLLKFVMVADPNKAIKGCLLILFICFLNFRLLRNTLRYCLGNLYDYNHNSDEVDFDKLRFIDKYMLHHLYEYGQQVARAYEDIDFGRVTTAAMALIHNRISTFYFDTVKDRLYNDRANSVCRRSCLTVLHHMVEVLTRSLAPIVPHLAEETFLHRANTSDCVSVFKTGWFTCQTNWHQPDIVKDWQILTNIKETFLNEIEPAKSREYDIVLSTDDKELFNVLKRFQMDEVSNISELCEIMTASCCTVTNKLTASDNGDMTKLYGEYIGQESGDKPMKYTVIIHPSSSNRCERCRKHTADVQSQLCQRCSDVLFANRES
uniref:isoleucine--tRNA ligase n=1 Tax=Saccoglossus kowalevskii TaxID=10224 RepID=A0ABM0N167_SACKO|nr:PREDICTED: isoleucine--tRNA ligase, mitochondrial-like [Saccoglossus kowalevskii]